MWPVYLINLARNEERLRNCDRQFAAAAVPYSRIEGIDGWNLATREIERVYDESANRRRARLPLIKPQIGLHLSHIKVWEQIGSGVAPGGFVFEDDFLAHSSLSDVLELLSSNNDGWDMIKLFSPKPARICLSRRPLGPHHEVVVPYRVPIANLAYGLTKAAAARLADIATPFFRACDEHHKFYWERNMRVSLVLPSPVGIGDESAQTGTVSSSRHSTSQYRGWARVRQIGRNISYQLHYEALLHFNRAKEILS